MTLLNDITKSFKGDKIIWLILFLLTAISALAVYSATGSLAFKSYGGNTEIFLVKQLIITALAIFLTWGLSRMHYRTFLNMAPVLLAITVFLLAFTLIGGKEVAHARRWLEVPFIQLSIQPSEFAKLTLIVFVARVISYKQEVIKDFKGVMIPIIGPIILVCLLIAPADLSTAMILFSTCFLMMFVGRMDMRYIGLLLLVAVLALVMLMGLGYLFPEHIRVHTWVGRFLDFFYSTGDGWQIMQSKIAVASGEFSGVGPGNSVQRNFLPSPYSDFIFAIICEEWGLIGGLTIILIYIALLIQGVRLVTRCKMAFGALLALGLTFLMVIQAFANIAVSLDLVPVTGVTLPLVSKGGSSLIFTSMAFGIILSVSRYIEKVEQVPVMVSDGEDNY